MSHQDSMDIRTFPRDLEAVFRLLLPEKVTEFARHGNATVDAFALAAMAIACWGWSARRTLTQRMEEAAAAVGRLFPDRQTASRQGVCQALATCGEQITAQVLRHVRGQLRHLKGCWTTAGKPTFAVDGTKFAAPRTAANQDEFAVASKRNTNRKGKKYRKQADASKALTVQVLATVFWHLGSGLPASWRLAPSAGSERKTAADMLDELPAAARVVGDAEYVGYPFWSAILDSGRSFVVRVGSNVTLLKKLDPRLKRRGDVVHCWPEQVQKTGQPPLLLRLIEMQTPRGSAWLLTNEFELTEKQIQELYRARWGVEVFFRTVKQNCGRAKLLCRTPVNVQTELNWTLPGIWSALFLAKRDLLQHQQPPGQLSPTRVMDVFAHALSCVVLGIATTVKLELHDCLKADESHRTTSKQSRHYPRKKQPKICGPPKIQLATKQQIIAAKGYR